MIIVKMIQMIDFKYLHLHIYMESMEFEQQIPVANVTRRSALSICSSIAIRLFWSIEIINTMTVGDHEILSLNLQILQMIIDSIGTSADSLGVKS
jgi:hypothetical protein